MPELLKVPVAGDQEPAKALVSIKVPVLLIVPPLMKGCVVVDAGVAAPGGDVSIHNAAAEMTLVPLPLMSSVLLKVKSPRP